MKLISLLFLLSFFPLVSSAQSHCVELFLKSTSTESSVLLPEYLGVGKNVEEFIIDGPFQDAAFELTDMYAQITDPAFISQLSRIFQLTAYELKPETDPNSNWFEWKAQFELQHPHVTLLPADWVRLWNLHAVLDRQFSEVWSASQISWMSAWLLKVVSPEHFSSAKIEALSGVKKNGPLLILQDQMLRQVFEKLLADPVFKSILLSVISERKKMTPKLNLELSKSNPQLSENLDSQIIVHFAVEILFDRLRGAIHDHDWKSETRSATLVPEDIGLNLKDLFASREIEDTATHLIRNIFVGTGFPIKPGELKVLLLSSLKKQMQPIISEALNRQQALPKVAKVAANIRLISAKPLPLTEHMNDIIEGQKYSFTLARNSNLGEQIIIFAKDSLLISKRETVDEIAKFTLAVQYGFTDIDGSNGIKKLAVGDYYEIKPGHSQYRMVVHRDRNLWTVVETLHKDKVDRFVRQAFHGLN